MDLPEIIPVVKTSIFWREVPTAGSYPSLYECSDGNSYFIKHSNFGKRRRQVINEFIGAMLADIIELNIPRYAIVEIDDQVLNGSEIFSGGRPSGIGFASRKLTGNNNILYNIDKLLYNNKKTTDISISQTFLKIILFDIWTKNMDRTIGNPNVLIEELDGHLRLVAIDHAEIFAGLRHSELYLEMNETSALEETLIPHDLFKVVQDNLGVFFDTEVNDILSKINETKDSHTRRIFDLMSAEELKLDEMEKESINEFLFLRARSLKEQFYSLIEEAEY